jgi:hypothetical protein
MVSMAGRCGAAIGLVPLEAQSEAKSSRDFYAKYLERVQRQKRACVAAPASR